MDNLVTVCKPCHDAIHNRDRLSPSIGIDPMSDEAQEFAELYLKFVAVLAVIVLFVITYMVYATGGP